MSEEEKKQQSKGEGAASSARQEQPSQAAQPTTESLVESVTFEVVEEEIRGGKGVRSKGIYLLPNLFTTAALFSGFYAIVAAMNEQFAHAAIAIFVSMVFDGLDGRVARMTKTQSAFGAEYDSLADCISFGAAPALVSYCWALSSLGRFGWMIAFIYMACAALRLARFNVQNDTADKRYFTGLPSPSAAAVVAGMVWAGTEHGVNGEDIAILAAMLTLFAGVMMVSSIKFNSFKEIDFRGRVPFFTILIVVLALAVISTDPSRVLLAMFLLYALSGPAAYMWQRRKRAR